MIRSATAADAAELARVAAITFPLACPPHVTDAAKAAFIAGTLSEARFTEYLDDDQRVLLVAEIDGAVSGYAMLVLGDPSDADVAAAISLRPTAELSKFYLMPETHGSGLATELMAASIAAAREQEALGLWLGVNQENARANRFYEKHGFTLVGTKRFLVGDRLEHDFVRELAL